MAEILQVKEVLIFTGIHVYMTDFFHIFYLLIMVDIKIKTSSLDRKKSITHED